MALRSGIIVALAVTAACSSTAAQTGDGGTDAGAPDSGTTDGGGDAGAGTCAAGSAVATQCASQNRSCVVAGGNAQCGDCLSGFLLANGVCRAVLTCADCTNSGETCTTPAGSNTDAVCGGCEPGEVANGTSCRPAYTCSTLPMPCDAGQTCMPGDPGDGGATTDAMCVGIGSCNCTGQGEDGVVLPDSNVGAGCICETLPGYFFSTGNSIGALPCDADNDGWVRTDAYSELTSSDAVIRAQARCDVNTIRQFILINDQGQQLVVPIPSTVVPLPGFDGGLPLFEPGILDDQNQIAQDPKDFPVYGGDGGRVLQANELNPLTKACSSSLADFNDDGAPDVAEWATPLVSGGGAFGDETSWSGFNPAVNIPANLQANFQVYTELSYFLELYRGWYSSANGGTYYIREKGRLASSNDHFALIYGRNPPDGGQFMTDYWHECPRAIDVWFGSVPNPVGMDFASLSAPSGNWAGMNAESQFKCVQILSQQAYGQLTAAGAIDNPQDVTLTADGTSLERETLDGGGLESLDWQVDSCAAQPHQYPNAGTPGPEDPLLSCAALPYPPSTGVAWAAVRLGSQDTYQRGCELNCAGQSFYCPGTDPASSDAGSCFFLCGDFSASDQVSIDAGTVDGGSFGLLAEVPLRALSPTVLTTNDARDGGAPTWTLISR